MRRFKDLEGSGLTFIGMGVSGGEEGARHGPSIMVGGTPKPQWHSVETILTAISAKFNGEPCAPGSATDGAGHFVKTIHNGIEYADMQMIAEIYGVMRDGLGMAPTADRRRSSPDWNKGRLNSYLIEITATCSRPIDPQDRQAAGRHDPRHAPARRAPAAGRSIEAQQLGVPATAIEAAVAARALSSCKDERRRGRSGLRHSR